MKLIHLSDLHLGKRVNGFSMTDDQRYILNEILDIAAAEMPDVVLIAGDVYDRSIPTEEAVELFDDFLVKLSKRHIEVCIISGNHDSEERVAFGGRLMEASGIHFAPVYNGSIAPLSFNDEYGTVRVWAIPFMKPANVRRFYPESEISSYTDAMEKVISEMKLDENERNVAVVHQFIVGASTCDSEERSVGGTDAVESRVFVGFDYVALGHLHGAQSIEREGIRYCGSPLKYSFSEAEHIKSVTVLELKAKGDMTLRTVPLTPLHDMRRLSGSFDEINSAEKTDDYVEITLFDEDDVPNAFDRLKQRYQGLMILKYDNTRTRSKACFTDAAADEDKSPIELFDELYNIQNGTSLNKEQKEYLQALILDIWEGEV